ncbi:MAG: superinfection immunity protein [Candidatus Gastranaerophilales bacterium]|nr:superinfection immunity protein [Candidatus Gastranaerophilales bacterium]
MNEILSIFFSSLVMFALIAISLYVYFFPTRIAFIRKHPSRNIIFWVNLLFGLTAFGWIITLIWAYSSKTKGEKTKKLEKEIEALNELNQKGIITEEEFNNRKNQLINNLLNL